MLRTSDRAAANSVATLIGVITLPYSLEYRFGTSWPHVRETLLGVQKQDSDPLAVMIPPGEIIRFYDAPSTRLAQALFRRRTSPLRLARRWQCYLMRFKATSMMRSRSPAWFRRYPGRIETLTPDYVSRARDRLWAGLPPASRSKQEFKDCEIFEEFVELATALRHSSFNRSIVFITPNSKEFERLWRSSARPRTDSVDLLANRCLYVGNAAWAREQ
jgi:hypothetical protein